MVLDLVVTVTHSTVGNIQLIMSLMVKDIVLCLIMRLLLFTPKTTVSRGENATAINLNNVSNNH